MKLVLLNCHTELAWLLLKLMKKKRDLSVEPALRTIVYVIQIVGGIILLC